MNVIPRAKIKPYANESRRINDSPFRRLIHPIADIANPPSKGVMIKPII